MRGNGDGIDRVFVDNEDLDGHGGPRVNCGKFSKLRFPTVHYKG